MMLEPGGIGVLRQVEAFPSQNLRTNTHSYQHHNIEEPAVFVGLAFPAEKPCWTSTPSV
jgi:hypothetical protein